MSGRCRDMIEERTRSKSHPTTAFQLAPSIVTLQQEQQQQQQQQLPSGPPPAAPTLPSIPLPVSRADLHSLH
ncbi:hypothetical protein CABS01_15990 [Colletotrichum abscissum]|uniref:Uncharacterized protein n=1 Tax=Colletotrichum abscissum TaxID=1671311 RepID=A0A9Q0AY64_9PEZI|nr:uncharacterized protein CABS01_15990 [Colletotrichum abscissum]KAI3530496.1 hypothetical protein CABS02_14493 [Colletotrichum abscissum]KAK1474150.1 hypothetical protein CABS01_15990 [Colletotrichum abscissum]